MKHMGMLFVCAVLCGMVWLSPALAQEVDTNDLMQEIQAIKERMQELEQRLQQKNDEIRALQSRSGQKEESGDLASVLEKWSDRVQISGAVEIEASSERKKSDGDTERNDDIALATAELGIDVAVNDYTQAHILLNYEDDDDEDRLQVDEATILLGGVEETYGMYFLGGKYYPHFGELNSWFVSDPLTTEVFEIRETAVQVGYDSDWVTAGIGAFHGDIDDEDNSESRINGFFADVNVHNPEDTLGGLAVMVGASYLSNVADTDTLQDEVSKGNDDDGYYVDDLVGGVAVYAVAEYDIFSLGAEYMTALDDFKDDEMDYIDDGEESRPAGWNIELAVRPLEPLLLGVRYGGTRDMYALTPETQYGLVASYDLLENITLSAEYMHGDYDEDNDDDLEEVDTVTMQLAVGF